MAQRLRRQAADFHRRPLVREGMWIAAGHGVTAVAGLVSIRLFTELASQSVFGAANLLIGMLTLGMHALLSPITQTQIRYHTAYNDAGNGDAYTWLIARLAAGAAAGIIALVAAVLLLWPETRGGAGLSVIAWLAAWVAVSAWRNVLIGRVQAERRQKRYALWVGTEALLMMACTGGMLALWPTVEGYVAGQIIGLFAPALFCGTVAFPGKNALGPSSADARNTALRQLVTYGVPFSGLMLMGWFSNLSERYILVGFLDTATVGNYVAAFGIASRPAMMVGGLLGDMFRAILFTSQSRGELAAARRTFRLWLAAQVFASGATVLVFILFGDFASKLLLAEAYREGAPNIMCWVAAAYGVLAAALPFENRVFSFERPHKILGAKTVAAVGSLILATTLVPIWGVSGAAMANAGSQSLYLLSCIWIVNGERRHLSA
jgi:O-antigen/teichoic acid export membrane protein